MIQYSRDGSDSSIGRGMLDSSHARGMTPAAVAPYSAGLAGVETSVPVVACDAAFFSTIATAMIEPS